MRQRTESMDNIVQNQPGLPASRSTKKEPVVYHLKHVHHGRVGPHGELRTRHTSVGAEESLQRGGKVHGHDLPQDLRVAEGPVVAHDAMGDLLGQQGEVPMVQSKHPSTR